jgi:hypothetical protein
MLSIMSVRALGGCLLFALQAQGLQQGPSGLNATRRGRRHSQLRRGLPVGVTTDYPKYVTAESCNRADDIRENAAVADITVESYIATLNEIVNLKDDSGTVTRSWSDKSGLANVQKYLKDRFHSLGLHSCLQKFSKGSSQQANVVAILPGSEPGSVTVGAHYDSRPFTGAAPGANDNGSGLAAMLSIAKAFVKSGIKPKKTLVFVGFAGEEIGTWGSEHFAQQLKESKTAPSEICGEDPRLASPPGAGSSFLQKLKKLLAPGAANASHTALVLDEIGWVSI